MRFFFPRCDDVAEAEAVYALLRQRAESNGQISPTRYFSVAYTHNGKSYTATVGEEDALTGEEVVAIFERIPSLFLIYTEPYNGYGFHGPYLASSTSAYPFEKS